MRAHRTAVVFHRSLVLEGLVNFLADRTDLEVTTLDPSSSDAVSHLKQLSPEVIIIDGEVESTPKLALSQLLADNPDARVIDVDPHHDELRVYHQHRVSVGKFDDLLEALGADWPGAPEDRDEAGTRTDSEPAGEKEVSP